MKDNEIDYLNTLFSSSSDAADENEVELPLIEVPDSLSRKLYAITEPAPVWAAPKYSATVKRGFFSSWPKTTSIAASLLVAMLGVQFYQQQQTLSQLEQAQADLATALHYLGEANRITRAQVLDSLNENMNRAGVQPAIDIGREAIAPNFRQPKTRKKKPNRTL
jgi:negative regulator of sigma E activity